MSLKQFLNKSEFLSRELNSRYDECDSPNGHKKPDVKNNCCKHCYRRLEYITPQADKLMKERQGMPWHDRPHDAPLLKKLRDTEIESQKDLDFFKGLFALEREEISKVKL